MNSKIISAVNLDVSAHWSQLNYGPPGSGKTYLAVSAGLAGFKTLFIDTEKGRKTLAGAKNVDIWPAEVEAEIREVYQFLRDGKSGYDVVFLDSLTSLQKRYTDDLKDSRGHKFGVKEWGEIIDWTRRIVRAFRDLPNITLVINCHSKEIAGDDGEALRIRPDLSGSTLPHDVGGMFDVVGYCHTRAKNDGIDYVIGFAPTTERHITKNRGGCLLAVEPADFGVIAGKIKAFYEQIKSGRVGDALGEKSGQVESLLDQLGYEVKTDGMRRLADIVGFEVRSIAALRAIDIEKCLAALWAEQKTKRDPQNQQMPSKQPPTTKISGAAINKDDIVP